MAYIDNYNCIVGNKLKCKSCEFNMGGVCACHTFIMYNKDAIMNAPKHGDFYGYKIEDIDKFRVDYKLQKDELQGYEMSLESFMRYYGKKFGLRG